MRINNINIIGFGKMHNMKIDFDDGLNVIYGKNEAGKSTTHSYIRAMLFGINKKKAKTKLNSFEKYEPWDNSKVYEGYLQYTYKNKKYTIHRVFNDNMPITIKDDEKGTYVDEPELFLKESLSHLTETSFNNSISISQLKSATETQMISELHKYIANLNTSGDMSIDTIAAIDYLKNQRAHLDKKLVKDATLKYTKNLGEARKLEKELSSDQYKNKIPEIQKKKEDADAKIKSNIEKINKIERDIENDKILLKKNGFDNKNDIDQLKIETEKIYIEYDMLRNVGKKLSRIIVDTIVMVLGLMLGVVSTFILAVSYPGLAFMVGFDSISNALEPFSKFVQSIPFPIAPLIGFFYAFSIICFIYGFVLLITDVQTKGRSEDMKSVLSEVFNHQINTPTVNENNMRLFKNHIKDMYNLLDRIDTYKSDIKNIEHENETLNESKDQYVKDMQEQQRLQFTVEQLISEHNTLKQDSDKLKKDVAENDNIQREIDSIDMALEILKDLTSKIKVMFGTHLNEKTSEYVSHITGGAYSSINVDDSLNITLNVNDRAVPLEQLSGGAMDQVYLALRLATTDIIERNGEKLPLLFDDCFAMYDNERLEDALMWLYKNINRQIIIFSCHTRESEILKKNKVSYNLINI